MTIKKEKQWLEVYGIKKENKQEQTKLKKLGYKRYPVKQCRTKWTTDTVEEFEKKFAITIANTTPDDPVLKKENVTVEYIDDEDYGRDFSNDLNSEIDRLNNIINELKQKRDAIRKPAKKKNVLQKIDLSKFVAKNPRLPILLEYTVKNGFVYATDMEKYIKVKKEVLGLDIDDGIYKSIYPVIESNNKLGEEVLLPIPQGTNKKFTEKEWSEIRDAIVDASFYVINKNFTPLRTGIIIKGNKVFGTDSYHLYETTLSFDTGLYINIPKDHIEVVKQQYGEVEVTINDLGGYIWITSDAVETGSLLIKGNIPDIQNENILPTLNNDYEILSLDNINELEKIMNIKGESTITIDGHIIEKRQIKYIKKQKHLMIHKNNNINKLGTCTLIYYTDNTKFVVRTCK